MENEKKSFLDDWNYKKHAIAVTALYAGLAAAGSSAFNKKMREYEKKQKKLGKTLAACYCFDMSVTYLILNCLKRHHK